MCCKYYGIIDPMAANPAWQHSRSSQFYDTFAIGEDVSDAKFKTYLNYQ